MSFLTIEVSIDLGMILKLFSVLRFLRPQFDKKKNHNIAYGRKYLSEQKKSLGGSTKRQYIYLPLIYDHSGNIHSYLC